MSRIALFLRDIRIEHTLFALPFAYVGAVMAARGLPAWPQLLWITLAVVGARTAGMAANRYFDREIDARNPRTARRPTASGALPPAVMPVAIVAGLALTLVSAWALNPLCVALMPVAALGLLLYPLCKRFTWSVHFVLGAVDALAPLGAFIAIAGTITVPAVLLFLAVTVWVAGFDILYALMDYDVDKAQRLHSFPAAFGIDASRRLPLILHAFMLLMLLAAGIVADAGFVYYTGVVFALALIAYEGRAIRAAANLFVLNERIFITNMVFSVAFLVTTLASYAGAR